MSASATCSGTYPKHTAAPVASHSGIQHLLHLQGLHTIGLVPEMCDGACCRGTAWSPIRSAQSLAKFFVITAGATTTAWHAHPQLLNVAAHVLHLDFKDSVTAFQTSFFSFLSLVFAIYSGNTMAFLYDVSWNGARQKGT